MQYIACVLHIDDCSILVLLIFSMGHNTNFYINFWQIQDFYILQDFVSPSSIWTLKGAYRWQMLALQGFYTGVLNYNQLLLVVLLLGQIQLRLFALTMIMVITLLNWWILWHLIFSHCILVAVKVSKFILLFLLF